MRKDGNLGLCLFPQTTNRSPPSDKDLPCRLCLAAAEAYPGTPPHTHTHTHGHTHIPNYTPSHQKALLSVPHYSATLPSNSRGLCVIPPSHINRLYCEEDEKRTHWTNSALALWRTERHSGGRITGLRAVTVRHEHHSSVTFPVYTCHHNVSTALFDFLL